MSIALVSALKSKDSSQMGSIIVSPDKAIVSTGYNGFPKGLDDTKLPTSSPEKYPFTIHAEMNAILYARRNLKDCIIFNTAFPCNECFKTIVQVGIKKVIYLADLVGNWKNQQGDIFKLSTLSNVDLIKFVNYNHVIDFLLGNIKGRFYEPIKNKRRKACS